MEPFDWDRAGRLTDILYGAAAAHGLIGYGPQGRRVGVHPRYLGGLPGHVSRKSVADDGPMWTALCVSPVSRRPHGQFHQLARELRPEYKERTDEQLWMTERDRCYASAQT
jgi:hypothetical protein